MAIAEVGSGTQRATSAEFSGADSGTLAFPANVVSGNLLIVAGAAWQATSAPTSIAVTDTRSTSYTVLSTTLAAGGGGAVRYWIAYGLAPSSGACTVTVNPAGALADFTFSIDEFSGVSTTPLDVDGGSTAGLGTDITPSDDLTTLTANDLVIGLMTDNDATVTITPGASYTQIGEVENNVTTQCHSAVFRLVTTAQAYTVDWSCDIPNANTWGVYTAAFKAAVAVTPRSLALLGVGA